VEYITAVWDIFGPIGNLVTIWYIFPQFGIASRKIWQPWLLIRAPLDLHSTCDGSARSGAENDHVHVASALLQDLLGGRVVVGQRVAGITVLESIS
jgi:hypothetical protein